MATVVTTESVGGPRGPTEKDGGVLRARDRRRLERVNARYERAARERVELVRELRERGATGPELAEVLHVSRQAIYKMAKQPAEE
jgi:predicted transcriptional regulator YheO